MEVDIAAIDEEIRKLQEEIRKLQLFRQLLMEHQNRSKVGGRSEISAISARSRKHSADKKPVRYEVLKYIADANDMPNRRTARQIAEIMLAAKFKFKAQDPTVSARESLRELEKEKLVEKVGTSDDGAALWLKTA